MRKKSQQKGLKIVIGLTAVAMVAEIAAGTMFNSLALLSDGWHMSSHLAAFGITLFAEEYAKKNINNPNYTFGVGKVRVLGGFASAVALAAIALMMAIESITRFFNPSTIQFNEAMAVAVVGLIVNLIGAFLLDASHHEQQNQNLKAASIHLLADVLTSVGAIFALFTQKWLGLSWIDPAIGLMGALIIAQWSRDLIKDTGSILLDRTVDHKTKNAIINAIEYEQTNRITDLQIWKIGENQFAANISLVTSDLQHPEYYKNLLRRIPNLFNVFVQVDSNFSYASLGSNLLPKQQDSNNILTTYSPKFQ